MGDPIGTWSAGRVACRRRPCRRPLSSSSPRPIRVLACHSSPRNGLALPGNLPAVRLRWLVHSVSFTGRSIHGRSRTASPEPALVACRRSNPCSRRAEDASDYTGRGRDCRSRLSGDAAAGRTEVGSLLDSPPERSHDRPPCCGLASEGPGPPAKAAPASRATRRARVETSGVSLGPSRSNHRQGRPFSLPSIGRSRFPSELLAPHNPPTDSREAAAGGSRATSRFSRKHPCPR